MEQQENKITQMNLRADELILEKFKTTINGGDKNLILDKMVSLYNNDSLSNSSLDLTKYDNMSNVAKEAISTAFNTIASNIDTMTANIKQEEIRVQHSDKKIEELEDKITKQNLENTELKSKMEDYNSLQKLIIKLTKENEELSEKLSKK